MRSFNKGIRGFALAIVLTSAGCSEYFDRRDTIAVSGGNAVATNVVTHMVDPWPRESANRNIAFNGARMQSAFERYRTNRVIAPKGIDTSGTYGDPGGGGGQNNGAPVGPSVTQPAAPVK
ncbi:MAG TPA: hypothetical protein VFP60_01295 [Pseudolabrys sp.]|nr:hypothetical protein [Pseudolabrys sp.]